MLPFVMAVSVSALPACLVVVRYVFVGVYSTAESPCSWSRAVHVKRAHHGDVNCVRWNPKVCADAQTFFRVDHFWDADLKGVAS